MKFVVYGYGRRLGLLDNGQVTDVTGMVAKYLYERQDELQPFPMAEALTPPDLESFIEGGERSLDFTRKAAEYLFSSAGSLKGLGGGILFLMQISFTCMPRSQRVVGWRFVEGIFLLMLLQWRSVAEEKIKLLRIHVLWYVREDFGEVGR